MPDKNIKILLLEDAAVDAELVLRETRRAGIEGEVHRVETASEFRIALDQFRPDVILADYTVPGFSGLEALDVAHSSHPDIPFIFVSGTLDDATAIRALQTGAIDVVPKSSLFRLPAAIERAVKEAEAHRQHQILERNLRESERRLSSILHNVKLISLMLDLEANLTYCNDYFLNLTGWRFEDVRGKNWFDLFAPPELDDLRDVFYALLIDSPDAWHHENEILTRFAGRRLIRWNNTVLRSSSGEVIGTASIGEDITERESAVKALRESDSRKDEFIATLSHELRNPLAPLRNCLHLLGVGGKGDESAKPVYSIMKRQVDHLVRLVDDLLEMSRVTRGTFELRKERVEIASIVRHAIETSNPLIQEKGHMFSTTLPKGPLWLDGDPVRLAQILANLLNNAAKYTSGGGEIGLEVKPTGNSVRISVRDNGIGMEPEVIPRAFEMFSRGQHPDVRSQSGLGIGLPLALRLAQMHGGTIEAKSEGAGKGSEFTLLLFSSANQNSTEAATDDIEIFNLTKKILIVDDNRDAADTFGLVLRTLGADVRVAHNGFEALEILSQYEASVLLLDIGMPDMDGYQLARQIRSRFPERRTPMIALTGWGQDEDRRKAKEAGFDGHLVKPVEVSALQKLLESIESAGPL